MACRDSNLYLGFVISSRRVAGVYRRSSFIISPELTSALVFRHDPRYHQVKIPCPAADTRLRLDTAPGQLPGSSPRRSIIPHNCPLAFLFIHVVVRHHASLPWYLPQAPLDGRVNSQASGRDRSWCHRKIVSRALQCPLLLELKPVCAQLSSSWMGTDDIRWHRHAR